MNLVILFSTMEEKMRKLAAIIICAALHVGVFLLLVKFNVIEPVLMYSAGIFVGFSMIFVYERLTRK